MSESFIKNGLNQWEHGMRERLANGGNKGDGAGAAGQIRIAQSWITTLVVHYDKGKNSLWNIKCFFQQLLCEKGGQTSHSSWRPEKNPFKGHKLENVLLILDLTQTGRPLVWFGEGWLFNSSSAVFFTLLHFCPKTADFLENLFQKSSNAQPACF